MPWKVAIREKDLGICRAHTWKDYFERSRLIALGLASLGFDHAEVRFAVVEDQEQVDKLLHVRGQCPRLEFVVYEDPRGMRAIASRSS